MHPTGALLYQPFLTGPAGAAGVKGGVDITDARSGALRMRIILPQQFMTDVDTLHGGFLTIDENGQRLFAITTLDGTPQKASLTVVQLAAVPLAIGSLSASTVPVAGGASITIRGSGFQSGIKVTIGGKSTAANFVDMNTITATCASVAGRPAANCSDQRERRNYFAGRRADRKLASNLSSSPSSNEVRPQFDAYLKEHRRGDTQTWKFRPENYT